MPLSINAVYEIDFKEIKRALATGVLNADTPLLSRIEDSYSNKLNYSILVGKQNNIAGFAIFEKLAWDTNHFGIDIGRINEMVSLLRYEEALAANDAMLRFIDERCERERFSCIYCRVDINDTSLIHSLESNGFRMIDVLTTLRFDFARSAASKKPPNLGNPMFMEGRGIVRSWKDDDLDELARIASTSYEYDRFHSDPMFPKDKSDELHGKWIVNCCKGLTDDVLVATLDKPVGFITCKIGGSIGVIDMVGVSKDAQKTGIGTMLVHAAFEWFKEKVNFVDIGTQNRNIPALRLYLNAGFRPISSKLTFHKWFAKTDS